MAKAIKGTRLAPSGNLVVQYTDNTMEEVGRVVGRDGIDGADGVGIVHGVTDASGILRVTLSNGEQQEWATLTKGADGARGPVGAKGDTGAAGAVGAKGDTGTQGAVGPAGAKGDTGATGASGTPSTPFVTQQATRTLTDRFSEVANLVEYKLPGESTYNEAMTRAIASGKPIEIPYSVSPYTFSQTFTLPTGTSVYGKGGRPTLKPISGSSTLFTTSGANVALRDFIVDGSTVGLSFTNAIVFSGATDCTATRVRLQGNRRGFRIEAGSKRVVLDHWEARSIGQHSVEIDGAATCHNRVQNGSTEDGIGFGVFLGNATHNNVIFNNTSTTTTGVSLELVGVTHGCYENKIIGNHVEGVNDTGISVTGYLNTIIGNTVLNCQGNGIHIYGERNTVSGNILRNNSQGYAGNALWRAGVAIQAGFGGTGQYNIVTANICDDDQATKTQQYGVWIGPHSYETWSSKTWAAERYTTYAGNIYYTALGGTSGATGPTHTSGTVSDGGVQWTFIRTPLLGLPPQKNQIIGNNIVRSALTPYGDTGGGSNNEFVGGFTPALSVDPLVTSTITNSGGVSALSAPGGGTGSGTGYNWPSSVLNGALPTVSISAPTGSGSTATAAVTSLFMIGFGTVSPVGSGYTVGNILTIQGGTPVTSATNFATASPRQLRVASVDGNGGILTVDSSGATGTYYYTTPWLEGATLTGGSGTGAKLTATAWRVGQPATVTATGSGYTAVPTVSYSPAFGGSAPTTVTLSSQVSMNAGLGSVVVNGTGTLLGTSGTSGAPVRVQGATVDASAVRVVLTSTYTVPANTSLVRFTQTGTLAASTVTLPTASGDGHAIQLVNYAGAITALTFSPAVQGFTNASALAANTSVRIRWDATDTTWHREQ